MTAVVLTLLLSVEAFPGHAVILLYHRFGDERYPTTSVSMEDFERQMRFLKEKGYRVIPLGELVKYLKEKKEIPDKTVAIAVDDGYRTTFRAYEVLKRYNFPFTVFLYMEAVGRYPDFLTIEQIREMERSGLVEFENHSYSHKPFGLMKDTRAFLVDLEMSEKRFEEIFGRKPRFYALPYGFYNRKVLEILKKRGYEAVFTQDPGNVGSGTDPYRIPRQAIVGSWSKLDKFRKKLLREPLPAKDILPPYGFLEENPPSRAGAVLEEPDKYSNCRIYISELGWKRAKREGEMVFVKDLPQLKRKWNRIGVKCINTRTRRWADTFWIVIRSR